MKLIRYANSRGDLGHAVIDSAGVPRRLAGELYGAHQPTDEAADVAKLLAPIAPTMIWGIGLNYHGFARESKSTPPEHPLVFAKGPNAVQHPGDPIVIPTTLRSDQVDYEGELAVVIGRAARNVSPEHALDHVFGYTCVNDVSSRDWQIARCGGQWCRSKTFDTFAPLGPCLVTADEIPAPNRLAIRTVINGVTMQDSNTSDMIVDVAHLVSFLSASTTLLPGTVILTGTPQGVGMTRTPPRWLQPGDVVTVEIEKIGRLTNPVGIEQP
ncbi:MAG: fumarylacetoacetate hydrolase family protein [Verrucomicrobia bacterium]|nr:fumarylacetoacetate hydrolase family protein [Verrucomicrobiota bacterium]